MTHPNIVEMLLASAEHERAFGNTHAGLLFAAANEISRLRKEVEDLKQQADWVNGKGGTFAG